MLQPAALLAAGFLDLEKQKLKKSGGKNDRPANHRYVYRRPCLCLRGYVRSRGLPAHFVFCVALCSAAEQQERLVIMPVEARRE